MLHKEVKTQEQSNDFAALEKALEADISGKNFLTRGEENTLVKAYKNNADTRACKKIWDNHQGFIKNIVANEHKRAAHIEFDDLMQEAALGFIEGLGEFDPERGRRVITYVPERVKDRVQRYVNANLTIHGGYSRFPDYYKDARRRYFTLQEEFENAGQAWPPDASVKREFKKETGIDFHELVKVFSLYYDQTLSLDAPVNPEREDGGSLLDGLIDTEMPAAFDCVALIRKQDAVTQAMKELEAHERDILRRRYGFDSDVQETLQKIGQDYGVGHESIRNRQIKAEEKLRNILVNRSSDIANDYTP